MEESQRRRMPRVHLTHEQFRLASNGKVFSVIDLSAGGMGLRVLSDEDLFLFPVGREITGMINLHREKYPVNAKVQRIAQDVIGCQFEVLPTETQAAITKFLDPSELGKELKPMPVGGQGGVSLWYHGPSGTDLWLWREMDGQFTRLLLCCHGCYVEWQDQVGVKTGLSRPSVGPVERAGLIDLETREFQPDENADQDKLSLAKKLILSSNLPQDLKRNLNRRLEGDA